MKLSRLLFILVVSVLTPFAQASDFVAERPLPLEKAYLPAGFDNDDTVEIVVTGHLPSTCYKMGPIATSVTDDFLIELSFTAYEYKGKCVATPIPFQQTVFVGRLRAAGNYLVHDKQSHSDLGKMKIAEAPVLGHGTDEKMYAPLTDAYLHKDGSHNVLRLVGAFPDSCMKFGAVTKTLTDNVLVVLPEVKRDIIDCKSGSFPFEQDFEIEEQLPPDTYLLHVRSMNGTSINKLVHNQ